MSERGETFFGERDPHPREASVERQLEIPAKTLPRMNGEPAGTHVSRLPHQEPSVIFVSSRTNGETVKVKRGLLSSAGHGVLRLVAAPVGAALFATGILTEVTLVAGLRLVGGVLTTPQEILAATAATAIVGGIALLDFATGRKKKFVF
ncbi:MAG: hypothetical protein V4449_03515 [Patescibacteria group bacterium]